jgi:2-polyprenyl-6-methoxyphenol hydroxylase-like FAD-dependent oxidoreductase
MDPSAQAVVLGGGPAGMLAARVLSDTFEQVTIIERHAHDVAVSTGSESQDDRPSAAPALAQVLSERARPELERLFPDLSAELTADRAAIVVPFSGPRPTTASEPGEDRDGTRLQFTQRFIQRHLSRRLTSVDAIATLHGCDAVGLVNEGGRCVGVRILPRSHSAAARSIHADLVVDAMGTGSRLCVWLDDIWRIRVPSEWEQITAPYASRAYRLPAGSLPDAVVLDHRSAYPYRAVVMAVEDGNHLVTVACPGRSPLTGDQFNELVSTLVPPTVATAIAGGRPLGPMSAATPARIGRRRFDRARHLPGGIVALGGSMCSFDPFYAQDFDVAVLEAATLGGILRDQHRYRDGSHSIELPRRYFHAVMEILDSAWDAGRPSTRSRSRQPGSDRHGSPGGRRLAMTTKVFAGSPGRNSSRSHSSAASSRSAASIMTTLLDRRVGACETTGGFRTAARIPAGVGLIRPPSTSATVKPALRAVSA